MTPLANIASRIRDFSLSLPGAVEEFPWGDRVVKVNKKIFVFLGQPSEDRPGFSMGVKLPESRGDALESGFGIQGQAIFETAREHGGQIPLGVAAESVLKTLGQEDAILRIERVC